MIMNMKYYLMLYMPSEGSKYFIYDDDRIMLEALKSLYNSRLQKSGIEVFTLTTEGWKKFSYDEANDYCKKQLGL